MVKLPLVLLSAATVLVSDVNATPPELVRLWETEATLKVPEGVHYDADRQVLYVSNIDGTEPWAKDGAGSIARVALDGRVLAVEWVKGLHAPKGLSRHGDRLYVADVDQLVVIDVTAGAVVRRHDVAGAKRLNDVSVAVDGTVYVTDSETGRVHRLQGDEVRVYSEAFKSPNGVLATADGVYVLDQETLYRLSADGKTATRVVGGLTGHVDGVELLGGDFLVTCWEGLVYHATADGRVTRLLDTRPDKANAADPGFDPKQRILYVPTFWKNTVVAYRLR